MDISDPSQPEVVGYYDDNLGMAGGVGVYGDYACLADDSKLVIIDISDVNNPMEVEMCDIYASKVEVIGRYAYVTGGRGFYVVDLNDLDNPEIVGHLNINANNLDVLGDFALLASDREVNIIDISDPTEPDEIRSLEIPENERARDVKIFWNYAYVGTDRSFRIFDLRTRREIGVLDLGGQFSSSSIDILGQYAFLGDGWLRVIDISDPTEPNEVGRFEDYRVGTIAVVGDYVYGDGFHVISIEDPENPESVGELNTHGRISSVTVTGNYAFIGGGDGLRIVYLNDSLELEQIGFFDTTPATTKGIDVSDGCAFIANWYNGLRIIDINDPANPVEIGFCDSIGHVNDVTISGEYAYLSDQNGLLRVISIDSLQNPVEVASNDAPNEPNAITMFEDFLYIADEDGLLIYNIEDPENPEVIGGFPTRSKLNDVFVDGEYAYVANHGDGLRIINVFDNPARPIQVGCYDAENDVTSVIVFGNFAYIAGRYAGVKIINISDPENPEEVGYYDTPGDATGVALSNNGIIYAADQTNLGIYRFTDPAGVDDNFIHPPSSFTLLPAFPNPFNSHTRITYNLPTETHLDLGLYDISGRQVMTLFSGVRPAGVWSATLDGSNLTSGLYFIKLNSTEQQLSQKVILVK